MARPGLLQVLHPPLDADYVEHFQRLATLNLEIRKGGATRDSLLRKAQLEAAVGNYVASRDAAAEASALAPEDAEAHYQLGVACALVALAHAGAVETPLGRAPGASLRKLMQEAANHLAASRRHGGDAEAEELAAVVQAILDRCADEPALRAALRRAGRCGTTRPPRPPSGRAEDGPPTEWE